MPSLRHGGKGRRVTQGRDSLSSGARLDSMRCIRSQTAIRVGGAGCTYIWRARACTGLSLTAMRQPGRGKIDRRSTTASMCVWGVVVLQNGEGTDQTVPA